MNMCPGAWVMQKSSPEAFVLRINGLNTDNIYGFRIESLHCRVLLNPFFNYSMGTFQIFINFRITPIYVFKYLYSSALPPF